MEFPPWQTSAVRETKLSLGDGQLLNDALAALRAMASSLSLIVSFFCAFSAQKQGR